MSGNLIGGVIGGVIGFAFGNPQIGWMVGSSIGGLFNTTKSSGAPELTDLRPQTSEYGRPIPIIYGTMAVSGNVIWASDLIKVSDGGGGGKGGPGGGGGSSPRYAANFAILICESNGDHKLGRIWAGPEKRLIWDGDKFESGALVFYDGSESQMPDPMMESYLGAGQVPAYRGYAYIVVEMFDVTEHDGNRIPFLTIEIGQAHVVQLGYVWPETAYYNAGNVVLVHGPGTGGVLIQQAAAPHTFISSHDYAVNTVADASRRFLDPDRNVIVTYAGTPPSAFYVMNLSTGAITQHIIAEPSTLTAGLPARSPYVGSAVYNNGVYLFANYQVGTLAATIYGVNPDTFETVFIYTYPGSPGNMLDWMAAPAGGGAYVIGLNNTTAMKFPLAPASAAVSMGAIAPPETPYSGIIFTIDPVTGYLWTVREVLTNDVHFSWTVHDPASATTVLASTVELDIAFHPIGLLSVPGVGMYCYGITGLNDAFVKMNAVTGLIENVTIGTYNSVKVLKTMLWDPVRGVAMGFRDGYGGALVAEGATPDVVPLSTWSMGQTDVSVQGQPLSDVVLNLSTRAGLTPDQVDVTDLAQDFVDGYALANQVTIRDSLATLMPVYFFDCVEDQGLLRFIKRGGDIAAAIPADDLGAHGSDEQAVYDLYETTRAQDEELPRTLSVNYILAATKYSPATKYARRLVGSSGDEARFDLPLVLSDTKGQQVANVNLHEQWISRITYKLSLGRKYSHLMPTDLIGLPGPNGQGFTARITKETQKANGVIEIEAVRDDSDVYQPYVIVSETPPPGDGSGGTGGGVGGGGAGGGTGGGTGGSGGGVSTPTAAVLEVLGINMLRDADNDSGYYVAASAVDPTATWGGADLYYSVDGGTTYTKLTTIPNEATMGVTTNVLGNFFGGNVPDELNAVNVRLSNGTLSSTNAAGLLAGTNAAVIGDEIFFFRDATLQTNGSYTLRGLLRGRRGSEYAMGTHQVGERFVLLDVSTLVRIPAGTDTIGVDKLYKAVASGMTLAGTTAVPFTNRATGLMPYSPVLLGGGRDASNNATLNWVRRSRISGEWRDGVDVPLGEATEAYEVVIFTSSARTTIARTITGLSSPTASYSAAQQAADGLTPGAAIYFRVYQLSAVVGRGHPADGSI